MSVAYNGSTVAAMDMDSKIGYKQFFSEGSKFQYSGKESLNSFQMKHPAMLWFGSLKYGAQIWCNWTPKGLKHKGNREL